MSKSETATINNSDTHYKHSDTQEDEWPDPKPFSEKGAPLSYPMDALPNTIREAVEEVQRFVKAPVSMVAGSFLSAMSIASQALINVERSKRLSGPVSLFMLTIAESGERKSTIDKFATSSIKNYEQNQAKQSIPALRQHAASHAVWDAKKKGLLDTIKKAKKEGKSTSNYEKDLYKHSHAEPNSPRIPRFLLGDETPESLAWYLAKSWPSAAVISSEAGVVFGSHGMGKESILRNLGLLNVLWDGGQHSVGRRTKDSFLLRGVRLSMWLQAQEPTLKAFFAKSEGLARGTGFIARFLVTWPESTMGSRLFTEAPDKWSALERFHSRIKKILNIQVPIDEEGILTPTVLTLSDTAKKAWVRFHDEIEIQLCDDGELGTIKDVAAKSADNVARIAGLFHIYTNGPIGEIDADTIERAGRIVAYHLNESRRFFSGIVIPTEVANAEKLERWLLDYCIEKKTPFVAKRYIQQYGPKSLRDGSVLLAAAKVMEDLGRARRIKEGSKEWIQINPKIVRSDRK